MFQAKHMVGKSRHKNPNTPEDPQRHSTGSSPLFNKSVCDVNTPANRASLVSIKEVFDSNNFTGSPVVALKETIDSHFHGNLAGLEMNALQNGSPMNSPSINGDSPDLTRHPLSPSLADDSSSSSNESPPFQVRNNIFYFM